MFRKENIMKRIAFGFLLLFSVVALADVWPFSTNGATTNIGVTATSQTLTNPTNVFQNGQLVLTCIGTVPCFVRFDGLAATVSNAMPILANSQVVYTLASIPTITTISTGTGSTLYATGGNGQ
jgi:hypothetical protein